MNNPKPPLPNLVLDSKNFGRVDFDKARRLISELENSSVIRGWNYVYPKIREVPIFKLWSSIYENQSLIFCAEDFPKSDLEKLVDCLAKHYDPAHGYLIFLTSGSTGKPKAVVHTPGSLFKAAHKISDRYPFIEGKLFHHLFPSHYMAGLLNCFIVPWVANSSIYLDDPFNFKTPFELVRSVKENRTEFAWLSPAMMQTTNEVWRGKPGGKGLWKNVLSATGPLSDHTRKDFENIFQSTVFNTYGSTELLFISSETIPGLPTSIGSPFPGVRIRQERDAEDVENKLSVLSDTAALGILYFDKILDVYLHSNIEQEGFLESNDLVKFRKDGALEIVGRSDDIVVLGGLNFALNNIEQVALEYEGVSGACAFAKFGGNPKDLHLVFEVTPLKVDFDVLKFKNFLFSKLGAGAPRVVLEGELPKTHNGKIDRNSLQEKILGKRS